MKVKHLLTVIPLVAAMTVGLSACNFSVSAGVNGSASNSGSGGSTQKAQIPAGWQQLNDSNLGVSVSVPAGMTVVYPKTDIADGSDDQLQADADIFHMSISDFTSQFGAFSAIAVDTATGNNVNFQPPVASALPDASSIESELKKQMSVEGFANQKLTTALGDALEIDFDNLDSSTTFHQAQVYVSIGDGKALALTVSAGQTGSVWSADEVVQTALDVAKSLDKA